MHILCCNHWRSDRLWREVVAQAPAISGFARSCDADHRAGPTRLRSAARLPGTTGDVRETIMKSAFFMFVGLYATAVVLFLIGTLGWFGQERDPLSGVFLMPLGLPWNLIGDRLGLASAALGLLSPAVNLGILFWLWKRCA
jgi:hypothetical protein